MDMRKTQIEKLKDYVRKIDESLDQDEKNRLRREAQMKKDQEK